MQEGGGGASDMDRSQTRELKDEMRGWTSHSRIKRNE